MVETAEAEAQPIQAETTGGATAPEAATIQVVEVGIRTAKPNPEKVTNSARIGTIAALRFWDQHVSGEIDDLTVEEVTEAINGGKNGLEHRRNQTQKATDEINCNN